MYKQIYNMYTQINFKKYTSYSKGVMKHGYWQSKRKKKTLFRSTHSKPLKGVSQQTFIKNDTIFIRKI